MKRIISTLIPIITLVLASFTVTAQTTQSGYVKTKGRMDSKGQLIPGTRLDGAAITLTGGRSTVSATDGSFTLTIPDKKFNLQNVQKQGYVLVDPEVLKKPYVYSVNPLVITMETPDKQLEDQLKSERKLRRKLQQQLQQREQEIDSLKENNKITEEEYHQALQKLYAEQESNEKLISDMAKRYAEVDYDLLDEFYRQVTFCIENGDLTRADSLLRSRGEVRKQVEDYLQEEQAIQEQKEQLQKAEEVHETEKEELARRCYSYYEKFLADFQNDSAAYYLELRANLDTTNVDWQLIAGTYFRTIMSNMDKSLFYIHRALRHGLRQYGENTDIVSTCYQYLSIVCNDQGRYDESLEYTQKALAIENATHGEKHDHVADCMVSLGHTYINEGELKKANQYLHKALKIRKQLFDDDSEEIADSYAALGKLYYFQGQYSLALDYFLKALSIHKKNTDDEMHSRNIAIACHNVGMAYQNMGKDSIAFAYIEKALNINRSIYGERHPEIAANYNGLGWLYARQKKYQEALAYYRKSLAIEKDVFGEYHENVLTLYDNISRVYKETGELDSALVYVQKCCDILKVVPSTKNDRKDFNTYIKLGEIYAGLEKYDTALIWFNLAVGSGTDFEMSQYDRIVMIFCEGRVNINAGNFVEAKKNFLDVLSIMKKNKIEDMTISAFCYSGIALSYVAEKKYPQALKSMQKALTYFKNGSSTDPETIEECESIIKILESLK